PPVVPAEQRRRELAGVRAPVLPRAGRQVADHLDAGGVQGGDVGGGVVEAVDVVHGDRPVRRGRHDRQHPVPAGVKGRVPAAGAGDRGRRRGGGGGRGRGDHAHRDDGGGEQGEAPE